MDFDVSEKVLAAETFTKINIPESDPAGANNAVIQLDGGNSHITSQDSKYLMSNPIKAVTVMLAAVMVLVADRERALRWVRIQQRWTSAYVTIRRFDRGDVRWYHVLGAIAFAVVALCGVAISNVVLKNFVLSSSSALFAGDVNGALIFALMPALFAFAIKAFEWKLPSEKVRFVYSAVLFGFGIIAFGFFAVAAAIAFAPDVGGIGLFLAAETSGNTVSKLLVLATICADISLGFTIFSGAESILRGRSKTYTHPNPTHALLMRQKLGLETELDHLHRKQALADDYLARAAAGRELTRKQSERDVDRARELWMQRQQLALGRTIVDFLNDNPKH